MDPLTYVIDRTRRFTTVDYHRQPSFEQWTAAMDQIFSDPKRKEGFGILLNREWVFFPADRGYIERMVRFIDDHQSSAHPIRWAIFVSDEGSFGMGRVAEQITKNYGSIRVFRRRPEAEAWLLQSREGSSSQPPTD